MVIMWQNEFSQLKRGTIRGYQFELQKTSPVTTSDGAKAIL